MFDVKCDQCDFLLRLDEDATYDEYISNIKSVKDDVDVLIEAELFSYMIYKCDNCEEVYRFMYKDLEKRVRLQLLYEVLNGKRIEMLRTSIDIYAVDISAPLAFCGECPGNDGNGNCLPGIMKQCSIRSDGGN